MSESQERKTSSPRLVNPAGNTMDVSEVHPMNACAPILVTPGGTTRAGHNRQSVSLIVMPAFKCCKTSAETITGRAADAGSSIRHIGWV